MGLDEPAPGPGRRPRRLEQDDAPARLQDTEVFAERHPEVGNVAKGEAHAEHVEATAPERESFGSPPHQRRGDRLARLPEHALTRVDAHDVALADDVDAPARHEAGAGRNVEQPHALAQPGPPQGIAAIPPPRGVGRQPGPCAHQRTCPARVITRYSWSRRMPPCSSRSHSASNP